MKNIFTLLKHINHIRGHRVNMSKNSHEMYVSVRDCIKFPIHFHFYPFETCINISVAITRLLCSCVMC